MRQGGLHQRGGNAAAADGGWYTRVDYVHYGTVETVIELSRVAFDFRTEATPRGVMVDRHIGFRRIHGGPW